MPPPALPADAVFADEARFDVVLMDCEMPELDGRAATEEIRTLEGAMQRSRLPIVALTAHAMETDRQQCLAAGMDDYLSKPFTSTQLAATLARWLRTRPDEIAAAPARRRALEPV